MRVLTDCVVRFLGNKLVLKIRYCTTQHNTTPIAHTKFVSSPSSFSPLARDETLVFFIHVSPSVFALISQLNHRT